MDTIAARRSAVTGAAERAYSAPPVSPRAEALLGRADALLTEAVCSRGTGPAGGAECVDHAYVAAVRGAAAVLAALPSPCRRGSRSAWVMLAAAAPELAGWADYFSGWSETHQAVNAGITHRVDTDSAETLIRQTRAFLDDVEGVIASSAGAAAARHSVPRAS